MSLPRLNRQTANFQERYPERIVQFGGGNFLRAFVDWMVQILNEQTDFNGSVVIIKPTARKPFYSTLFTEQDGLFHVQLHGLQDGYLVTERSRVTCVSRAVNPYAAYEEDYLALAAQPEIRFVVSNTTEAGIVFEADNKFEDHPANSFPGKLTQFLYHRFQHFEGDTTKGCIILPVELIESNGSQLKACVQQYIDLWNLGEGFANWINEANTFCDTLVDRIVTGFPKETAEEIMADIGYDDQLLVEGEQFHKWVIQGPGWISDELPLGQVGLNVKIVDDLTEHRTLKVRILNGAHTAMVPLGLLMGIETVREAVEHPVLGEFVQQILSEDIIPALQVSISDEEVVEFANDVLIRFQNPHLHHLLESIALNSLSKFKTRLLPSLLDYVEKYGKLPPRITLALGGLIRMYTVEWKQDPVNDDAETVAWIRDLWKTSEPLDSKLQAFLSRDAIWGMDLSTISGLKNRLNDLLTQMEKEGVQDTIEHIVS